MRSASVLALALLLTGCASSARYDPHAEIVLPLNEAWFEGRKVEYVTTDISSQPMAQALGVNYVPRLADALPGAAGQRSIVERVYKFAHGEQISVFQSVPKPAGGDNQDASYSPLWRLVMVRWLVGKPEAQRELRSEEEVLAAADRGELALDVTGIVVNCPITRSVDGQTLKGFR